MTRDRRSQCNDCSLESSSLDEAAAWIEQQHRDWDTRFDRLDEHLQRHPQPPPNTDSIQEEKQ